uniref:Calcineurin-like phosphoesterase domain-containing protein n=1 Tax=Salix viminalis TaxID=40686 RepID=A0A6N2KII9_SALVM
MKNECNEHLGQLSQNENPVHLLLHQEEGFLDPLTVPLRWKSFVSGLQTFDFPIVPPEKGETEKQSKCPPRISHLVELTAKELVRRRNEQNHGRALLSSLSNLNIDNPLLSTHPDRSQITHRQTPSSPQEIPSSPSQVADMHFGTGVLTSCKDVLASEFHYCSDLNTTHFLKRIIEAEKPDFIAFTGDNIFGSSTPDAAESLLRAFAPAMESGLPWAAVLGNHDQESTMTRLELMSFISLLDYSVSQTNPSVEDASSAAKGNTITDIDGFGNYNLRVYGAPGSHSANSTVLDLFFLDSGDREVVQGVRTYGWIKESQLRWLHGVSKGYQHPKERPSSATDCLTTVHVVSIPTKGGHTLTGSKGGLSSPERVFISYTHTLCIGIFPYPNSRSSTAILPKDYWPVSGRRGLFIS